MLLPPWRTQAVTRGFKETIDVFVRHPEPLGGTCDFPTSLVELEPDV